MKKLLLVLFFSPIFSFSQLVEEKIKTLQLQIDAIEIQKNAIQENIDELKFQKISEDLLKFGLPAIKVGEEVIAHSAYSLVYSEQHEQAKWVAHIIIPDIINGKTSRSNDFREDSLIKTGSATEKDYFLKKLKAGTKDDYEYDGFGYDRGHLAPSADFRWSKKAVSESFYYSNMSPQLDKFNREKWADLEGLLRGYVYDHPETQLFVVTGPLLNDSLAKIEQGVNKVSIPNYFYKVALDLKNKKAIAFIMPNTAIPYPLSSYAVPINEVEEVTGINFFYQLDDVLEEELESQKNVTDWVPEKQKSDVDPVYPPSLPPGTFNTVLAKQFMNTNKKVTIVGTVVSGRTTNKGNLTFDLDKKYPNTIFTVYILKQNIINFTYDPLEEWMGKQITLKEKIGEFNDIPTMFIEKEEAVEVPQNGKMILVIGDE